MILNSSANPLTAATVKSWSETGKSLDYSHGRFHFKAAVESSSGKAIVNHINVFDRYFQYFSLVTEPYTLTDAEVLIYQYQPKKFCMDKYGTTELWSLLLRLNNMTSSVQFNRANIKSFTPDVTTLIQEIMILEEDNLLKNALDVSDQIK